MVLFILNLGISICYLGVEGMLAVHRGVPLSAPSWFIYLLCSADLIFSVVLLIGAHKKQCTLLNAFYYYSLSSTLAAFACLVVVWFICHNGLLQRDGFIELAYAFSSLVVHIYLLLLIRSEVKKLRNGNPYVVVNHMTDVVIEQPMEEGQNRL